MTCQRCHGMLCFETDQHWSHWHCLTCGDRFDTTVLNNRWLYRELKLMEFETRLRVPTAQ